MYAPEKAAVREKLQGILQEIAERDTELSLEGDVLYASGENEPIAWLTEKGLIRDCGFVEYALDKLTAAGCLPAFIVKPGFASSEDRADTAATENPAPANPPRDKTWRQRYKGDSIGESIAKFYLAWLRK